MHRAYLLPCLIALLIGCGSGDGPAAGGSTADGGSDAAATERPIPCGATSCSADEYCFWPAYCAVRTDAGSCPSTCGPMPDSCDFGQCTCPNADTGFGGYFGAPDGGTPYPDHQVSCYGS